MNKRTINERKTGSKEVAQTLLLLAGLCPMIFACESKIRQSEQLDQLTDKDRAELEQLLEVL